MADDPVRGDGPAEPRRPAERQRRTAALALPTGKAAEAARSPAQTPREQRGGTGFPDLPPP